jgi:hypothetical protein
MTGDRRLARLVALALGGLLLALCAADWPLSRLAHQSVDAGGGSVPVWVSAGFGLVGFVLAWRRPANPLGWVILGVAACFALAEDASFYTVADYRLRHGDLPLGGAVLLAQPGWAPGIVGLGLVALLFPDGRPPSSRWRWVLWLYLALGALWIVGAEVGTVIAIGGHQEQVDAGGNLLALDSSRGVGAWWMPIEAVFFLLLLLCWLASVIAQVLSYRRSAGERRQQLKWLLTGTVVAGAGLAGTFLSGGSPASRAAGNLALVAVLALPFCIGFAILKYRLFDIERIISRALGYAIVTGLLVGAYTAIVLLATRVVSITTPVAVAGSTLAAAALFNPLRRRVQRAVDRRFNRAHYDADETVAAFASRLQDTVSIGEASAELVNVVHRSLEPEQVTLWLGPGS